MNEIPDAVHPTQHEKLGNSHPHPRRRRKTVIVVVTALSVTLALLWIGWNPPLPSGRVHLVRDQQGRLAHQDEQATSGLQGQLHAGGIQAQNNLASTSAESRSGRARFASRRLAVLNRSEHLLMQRVGIGMLEHLKQLQGFEHVEYYPSGQGPDSGQLAPDVVVTLELIELDNVNLAVARRLHAEIQMTASSGLQRCSHSYHDGLDPPRVQLDFAATLDHRSTTTGIGSPASRYKLPAENIAQQLGEALVKKLNDLYQKDGPLPDLPDDFYPAYHLPPELVWPDGVSATLLASCRGLMMANETLWQLDTQAEPATWIEMLQQDLESDGWKTSSIATQPGTMPYLRMTQGASVLTVYRERQRSARLSTQDAPAEPFHAHYVQRMEREQIAEAVNRLLDADAPLETVLCFERHMRGPQRERLLQRLLDRPPKSPDAWLLLAEMHDAADRKQAAIDALLRADLLLRTVVEPKQLQQTIDNLAKKLDAKAALDQPPTPELLQELGFVELTSADSAHELEVEFDEPALFFHRSDDGDSRTIAIRIIPGDSGSYALSHINAQRHGRSWGSGGMSYNTVLEGIGNVTFAARRLGEPTRFRLETRVE